MGKKHLKKMFFYIIVIIIYVFIAMSGVACGNIKDLKKIIKIELYGVEKLDVNGKNNNIKFIKNLSIDEVHSVQEFIQTAKSGRYAYVGKFAYFKVYWDDDSFLYWGIYGNTGNGTLGITVNQNSLSMPVGAFHQCRGNDKQSPYIVKILMESLENQEIANSNSYFASQFKLYCR